MGNRSLLSNVSIAKMHELCKSYLKFQPQTWYTEEDCEDVPKQWMTLKGTGEMLSICECRKAGRQH